MSTRAWVGLFVAVALSGCRNVDLPSGDALGAADGGRGPDVALRFSDGASVALSAPLGFSAASLVGVASVSVSCGGVTLADWTSEPYQGQVDLSPCVPFGQPTDAGEGIRDLALVASATDADGRRTDLPFHLRVDVTVPVLTSDLGERLHPGRPVDFTLTSSIELGATPVATLADLPVTLTPDAANPRLFHAHLAKAPDLGIDALPDGGVVTLEVLQDVERTVALVAEAVAPNGNRGKLNQQVLLSRVLWDKPLPAPLAAEQYAYLPESLQSPTPIPEGLVVALSGSVVTQNTFTPGVFAADSGALTLDQPLLDGGWSGLEIDAEGWVTAIAPVFSTKNVPPNPTSYLNALAPSEFVPTVATPPTRPVRVRGEGQLCWMQGVSPNPTGCATSAAGLECIDHTGTPTNSGAYTLQLATDNATAGAADVVMARSGHSVFVGGYGDCTQATPTYGVGTRDGGLTFAPATYPTPDGGTYTTCEYAEVHPVLPTGDGAFVLMPKLWCINAMGAGAIATGQPVVLVGPDGATLGSYAVPSPWEPTPPAISPGVLGTWGADHALMVLEPSVTGTAVDLFPPDGGVASLASTVPGAYAYPPDQNTAANSTPSQSMPRDVVRGALGVSVLTENSTYARALLQLGPDLKPRWIYRYPRLVFQDALHLYALDDTGPLYLVDTINLRVLAIER